MDKEVEPAVLAVINEKRLKGEKRTPVEIIARMGVPDARQKSADSAWLATGGNVIATLWAEWVNVSVDGRWFCIESLDVENRVGGGDRSALQVQRAKDRLALLKRTFGAEQGLRAVLQTNRIAIAQHETDRAAKVSTRVPDDEEWHVASWDADQKMAVLVRGARGWQPTEQDMEAARRRGGGPAPVVESPVVGASREEIQVAAMAYLTRHFAGYGYKAEDVSGQKLGHDIEVSDKKGAILLRLAVKGTAVGSTGFRLTHEERADAQSGDTWRLAVVADSMGPTPQHKLYKGSEVDQAPGLETAMD